LQGQFDINEDDTVTAVAVDEYGFQLFVYTLNHMLYVYKADNSEFKIIKKVTEHFFEEMTFAENGVFIVAMEYVQELAAVVMAFSNGEIHLFEMET
jgi:tricorn protease-like protein